MDDPGSTLADVVDGLRGGDSGGDYPAESPDKQSSGIIAPETMALIVVMLAVAILIAAWSVLHR